MIPPPDDSTTLVLRRTFAAPRQRVFQAWVEPAAVQIWFRPRGKHVIVRQLDARIGGTFRFEIVGGGAATGTYLQVVAPEKLAFTWSGEATRAKETIVTLDFLDQGETTEVVLTHANLGDPALRALFGGGWPTALDALAAMLVTDAQFL